MSEAQSKGRSRSKERVPAVWVGSVVIDCARLDAMVSFWQEALRYVPRDPLDEDGVVLKDPRGEGPNLSLNRSGEPLPSDYRLHLDLYSSDPEREVERLVGLGAAVRETARPGRDFVTLADPDGNLFDVIDKKGWSFGRRA
jgi:hypothetical protein